MGKGDKKSRRGKLFKGSYGKSRPRKMVQAAPAPETAAKGKPKAKSKKASA